MASSLVGALLPRAEESVEQKFLNLMADPFGQELAEDSIVIAVLTSLAITTAIFLAFCLLRPFNAIVYAPRLRHTDEKHRPPPLGKGLFAWWNPVFKTHEDEYVEKIGLDATIFLRVARMCRNLFAVLAIVGCAIIIPINVTKSKARQNAAQAAQGNTLPSKSALFLMTPKDLDGEIFYAFVGVAYLFDFIICAFLWWTYRAVHRLRRKYLDSPDYQNSLHSRTLMITDVKRSLRSDQGLLDVVDSLRTTPEVPRASIGRNVKDIPELIEQHEQAVMDLEKVLSKYLRNPNKLPATRPLCKPSKSDPEYTNKEEKVDAITYLTARIERLESKIKEVRETVDRRDAMPYGFASYETLESAHSVAYTAKNKHPKGTTVNLAPRPKDIIWKNLPLDAKTRRWRRFINNLWITLLTVLYFIPNALIAVFLAKLNNLAFVWPEFGTVMARNPKFWAIVQGIAAPALTSLFYYFLPIIFRRLSMQAGDLTKTSRERHVIHQLYSFFVFNNLFIFSVFAAAFGIVTAAVSASQPVDGQPKKAFLQVIEDIHPFAKIMDALCNISPFWVTWLVQRNLGAAIDLAQFVNLAWGSVSRKFLHPTPRELIKRTAPPPFDYASYYNYFLFYSTVALCFASLQPITLVVTAIYFSIDASMKKYLLLYIFCTKNESGGLYWRVLFNRFLVAAFLSNCVIALMCGAKGGVFFRWKMLSAMVPLPLLLIGFKLYCKNAFDSSIKYYTKGDVGKGTEAPAPIDKESRRRDRVAVRFGHPALYQKLTVPMVHEKSKHLLSELYRGRLDGDLGGTTGYSDVYMKRMSKENPGKVAETTGPFEFVSEGNMDFENFKNRPEFSDDHGGEGSVYGQSIISRPDTPAGSVRGRSSSRDSERTFSPDDAPGVTYPAGYHSTPSNLREISPSPDRGFGRLPSNQSNPYQLRDQTGLLSQAAPMGHQNASPYTPYTPDQDNREEYFRK
ncbi:DUF221-domain-containing protein [Melanomma pulvis-pyrius CBS 109.77]|uniref:DUF221-domain-containing protein n=1 Tax=Melanomma pulvis-pyrius CBS 109.77 TaxID=1314802 RepID=A0A6A6WU80_9PLEO|nr:DUF221-domain-containing protein [Melanomma pulvis-pyrius CBS 109.77]